MAQCPPPKYLRLWFDQRQLIDTYIRRCQWYFIAGIALNNLYVILVRHLASDVELCVCFLATTTSVSVFCIRQTRDLNCNLLKSISSFI